VRVNGENLEGFYCVRLPSRQGQILRHHSWRLELIRIPGHRHRMVLLPALYGPFEIQSPHCISQRPLSGQ
jgi:hypothetical protein